MKKNIADKIKLLVCYLIDFFSILPRDLVPMKNWERFYGSLRSLKERARANIYNHMKSPRQITWYNGLKFMIYPDNDISRALFSSGIYEPNSLLVVKKLLPKGGVFLDIGANAGVFTLAASQWVGAEGVVVAFEPSSREYRFLEENVVLNRISNVRFEKCAISNKAGSGALQIAVGKHNGQNTLCCEFAYEGVASGAIETVSVQTLDRYVLEKGIERIDLIKLDIEGAEYLAFQGAQETFATMRPALIFEVVKSALQKNGIDVRDMEALLTRAGYKVYSIDEETATLVICSLEEMKDGNAVALPLEKIGDYANIGLIHD